jgi:hypothetical protein
VQFLLDRGYAVLAVNLPNRGENEDSDGGENESEISPETEYTVETVKWCFDNRIVKVGNVIILSGGKNAVHVVRAYSEYSRYFAGCVLLTPVFSERNNPTVNEDIFAHLEKPLLIFGHINDVGRYVDPASMKKSRWCNMLSCIVYHKNPSDSLVAGVFETAFAKMRKNSHYEEISKKDLSDLTALADPLAILKIEINKKGNERESAVYNML